MKRLHGFTLVEMMIGLAVIGVVTAIAIPAYRGYIATSQENVAGSNLSTLRMFLENHFLENGVYVYGSYIPGSTDDLTGPLGWQPEGDEDKFTYVVSECAPASANCYTITVTPPNGNSVTFTKQ